MTCLFMISATYKITGSKKNCSGDALLIIFLPKPDLLADCWRYYPLSRYPTDLHVSTIT